MKQAFLAVFLVIFTFSGVATQATEWGPAPTIDQVKEWGGEIKTSPAVQETIALSGPEGALEPLKELISKTWDAKSFHLTATSAEDVTMRGKLGEEQIHFTKGMIENIKKLNQNPASGAGLENTCPSQAEKMYKALGKPGKVNYFICNIKCQKAKEEHLKTCQLIGWKELPSGPVALSVCEPKKKVHGQVSTAWRFDPKKSQRKDGFYRGLVVYSDNIPVPGYNYWPPEGHPAWACAEELAKNPPQMSNPKLYDTCGWELTGTIDMP